MRTMAKRLALTLIVSAAFLAPGSLAAQRGVTVGQQMPDITLPAVQGGEVSLADFRGKNVLLIFPRGRVSDHWCQICHYQYAELVKLQDDLDVKGRHNLEIVFALPYGLEAVQEWVDIFPAQMETIDGWKNPPDEANLSERRRNWMETARRIFPLEFTYENGTAPVPFPILVDEGAEVSRRLGLFRTEWDGSEVDQNAPTIFIIDGDGVVQFKYHSQTTFDRPSYDYLFRVIERLVETS